MAQQGRSHINHDDDYFQHLLAEMNRDIEKIAWYGSTEYSEYYKRYANVSFVLDTAKSVNVLTEEEYTRLTEMINSPDRENMTVVEELLKQRLEI